MNSKFENISFPPIRLNYTPDGNIDYSEIFSLSHEQFPPFEFEKSSMELFPSVGNYLYQNWHYSLVVGGFYLAIAFALEQLMKNFEPIKLKWSFFIWNMIIGIFSIVGFARTAPPLLYRLSLPDGFYKSICHM